jgi:hypothetical protein
MRTGEKVFLLLADFRRGAGENAENIKLCHAPFQNALTIKLSASICVHIWVYIEREIIFTINVNVKPWNLIKLSF